MARALDAAVPRPRNAAWIVEVDKGRALLDGASGGCRQTGTAVVDDDYLGRRHGIRRERSQATLERPRPVAGGDDDRDGRRGGVG